MLKGTKCQIRPVDLIGNAVSVMAIATRQREEESVGEARTRLLAELGRQGAGREG